MKYTEQQIQLRLFNKLGRVGSIYVPNSMVFGYEADVLIITKARYVFEYEIKLNHADFLADAQKKSLMFWDETIHQWRKKTKHGDIMGTADSANYFSYVAPAGVITIDELPPMYGLIEFSEYEQGIYFDIKRKVRRLHKQQLSDKHYQQIMQSLSHRYMRTLAMLENKGLARTEYYYD